MPEQPIEFHKLKDSPGCKKSDAEPEQDEPEPKPISLRQTLLDAVATLVVTAQNEAGHDDPGAHALMLAAKVALECLPLLPDAAADPRATVGDVAEPLTIGVPNKAFLEAIDKGLRELSYGGRTPAHAAVPPEPAPGWADIRYTYPDGRAVGLRTKVDLVDPCDVGLLGEAMEKYLGDHPDGPGKLGTLDEYKREAMG